MGELYMYCICLYVQYLLYSLCIWCLNAYTLIHTTYIRLVFVAMEGPYHAGIFILFSAALRTSYRAPKSWGLQWMVGHRTRRLALALCCRDRVRPPAPFVSCSE